MFLTNPNGNLASMEKHGFSIFAFKMIDESTKGKLVVNQRPKLRIRFHLKQQNVCCFSSLPTQATLIWKVCRMSFLLEWC